MSLPSLQDNNISLSTQDVSFGDTPTTMNDRVEPRVLLHPPQDHRYVHPEELKKIAAYNVIMNRDNTTIMDYSMTKKGFLKPTSAWSELHIVAFRCLLLENLPISRILPPAELPDDNDETMKLVIQHLSDSQEDVRSGKSVARLGPATSIYQRLEAVLRSEADSVPIPPSSNSLSGRSGTSTDKAEGPLPIGGMDPKTRSKTSMETNRFNTSSSSGGGVDKDKLEVSANQAVVWFLGILCAFERDAPSSCSRRLSFRNDRLPPKLMLHGQTVKSYNDGGYYIETRSTNRPTEWVRRDKYPRASVECKRKRHTRNLLVNPQEVGEMMAIAWNRESKGHWSELDREVHLLGIHNYNVDITTAEFPPDYFAWVQREEIPRGQCLVLRRSVSFDLSRPESRIEGCRAIIGLMRRISKRDY